MFSINLDDAFEGYAGGIFFGIGFIVFCILALTTNYVSVGLGIGLAFAGLVSLLSSLYHIYEMFTAGDKKKKTIGVICTVIIAGSIIFSIINPLYMASLKINFSRIASVFVEPFIIYAIVSIVLSMMSVADGGKISLAMKVVSIIGGAGFGILIAGICYFTSLTPALTFLNKNFSYEDRQLIKNRTMTYGSNDFTEVFPKVLKEQKEIDDRDNLDQEQREKHIAKVNFNFKNDYHVYNFIKEEGEHLYSLMIEDQAKYDETGDFPKYEVKVNLETYDVLSIEKIEHKNINEIFNDINKVPVVEENN